MMTDMEAIEYVRELGHIYAVALAEKGHNIDDKSDLMNGLAAYYLLKLEGEMVALDESVKKILMIFYEEARFRMIQAGFFS